MCMCNFTFKGCPRSDLYCVRRDVKPYALTQCSSVCGDVLAVRRDLLRWKLSKARSTTPRRPLTRSSCFAQYVIFTLYFISFESWFL